VAERRGEDAAPDPARHRGGEELDPRGILALLRAIARRRSA
jgi:hypothetical protein